MTFLLRNKGKIIKKDKMLTETFLQKLGGKNLVSCLVCSSLLSSSLHCDLHEALATRLPLLLRLKAVSGLHLAPSLLFPAAVEDAC